MAFTLGRIYYFEESDNQLLFFVITTYLLNFILPIYLFYFNNLVFSCIIAILLAISSLILFIEIKRTTNNYKVLAIPYVLMMVFIASYITTTLILG